MKIGIDLGGTKTEGILIDNEGKELIKTRIKTQKNYQGTIDGINITGNWVYSVFAGVMNHGTFSAEK